MMALSRRRSKCTPSAVSLLNSAGSSNVYLGSVASWNGAKDLLWVSLLPWAVLTSRGPQEQLLICPLCAKRPSAATEAGVLGLTFHKDPQESFKGGKN